MADEKPKRGRRQRESLDVDLGDTGTGLKDLSKALGGLRSQISELNKSFSILAKGNTDLAKGVGYLVSEYEDINAASQSLNSLSSKAKQLEDKRLNAIAKINVNYGNIANTVRTSLQFSLTDSQNIQDKNSFIENTLRLLQEQGKLNSLTGKQQIDLKNRISGIYDDEVKRLGINKSINTLTTAQTLAAGSLLKLNELQKQELLEQFKKENDLIDASAERIAIEKGLIDVQKELDSLAGKEGATNKERINQLEKSRDLLVESKNTQDLIDAKLEDINKKLKEKKILEDASKSIGDKLKETLGEQGEEILHIGHAIKDSMISPMALVGALLGNALEEFMRIGKDSRAFLDSSKLTVEQTEHLRHYAHDVALEYRAQGVQMKDVLNSSTALVNQFGSLNRVSDKAVEKATLLGKAFGVSAENAAGVLAQVQRSTGASAETAGNIAALGANFAKAAGVAPDAVMQDIASSSDEIAKYFKGTPKDLFKTAVEARRLGLDLKKVAGISQNLLNFESSIEDQMTASVLLGREINLDKARQLAMEGKIQEAAEETLKQVGSLADFNKMNAVQKEAIAKAAGMSVGDLQKSLESQEALKSMTSEQRKEYEKGLAALNQGNESAAERLLKEQRNQLTQEKIADAVAKISDIFANVLLPVIEPIFDFIAGIFSYVDMLLPYIKTALQIFLGWKAVTFLLNTQFFKTRGLIGSFIAPFQAVGKGLVSVKDGIVGAFKSTKEWYTKIKEGDGIWKSIKNSMSGVWDTVKTFFVGKGPKEWGKDAKESLDTASKAGGSFFDKFKKRVKDFSFGPMEEKVESITGSLGDAAKEKGAELTQKPAEDATETIQDKATGKVEEIVGGKIDSAVEGLQGKAEEKGGELISQVSGQTDEAAKVEAKVKSAPGTGIKEFLTNVSEGLKAMSKKEVFQGIGAVALAGPAFLVFALAWPGLFVLSKINGEKIQENLYGLSYGLQDFAKKEVKTGAGNLALAGLGFLALTLGLPGFLVAMLGTVVGPGLTALSLGLTSMGNAGVKKGVTNLALLGLSLIPAVIAFNMLGKLDVGSVITFTVAISALAAVATLLGNASAQLVIGAYGIGILGAALIPAAYAFKMLEGIKPDLITTFSIAIGSLAVVATLLAAAGPLLEIGAVGIGILGLALIPFAIAMDMVKKVDPKIMISFADAIMQFSIMAAKIGIISVPMLLGSAAIVVLSGALTIFGLALQVVAPGLTAISTGLNSLVESLSKLDPGIMWSVAGAFGGIGLALGGLAIATAVMAIYTPGLFLLGDVLIALGASALLVGIGLQIASGAVETISNSLTNLVNNVSGDSLISMSKGLVALAGGIGILALAAVGFSVAIIPLTIFTGLMGLLGTTLNLVGAGINSIVTGIDAFATTMTSLLPMVDQIGVLSTAFSDLALSIGEVGIASVLAFPAMAALGGVASLLGGLFGKEEAPAPAPTVTPAPMPTTGVGAVATTTPTTAGTTTATETVTPGTTAIPDLTELMAKLDSLISAVNGQPIQLVVNGKTLAEVVGRNTTRSGAVGK
jgi:hypothetical protein